MTMGKATGRVLVALAAVTVIGVAAVYVPRRKVGEIGPDGIPYGATFECKKKEKDGKAHYSFAKRSQGACSSWGGIKRRL